MAELARKLKDLGSAGPCLTQIQIIRWNPMEGQIPHGLLYSEGYGLSGQLTGAVWGPVCCRQLLAKPLLKARTGENWTPEIAIFGFLTTRLKT